MREIIGKLVEGRDLVIHSNFPFRGKSAFDFSGRSTLLIGGTHGDERATVAILENFVQSHLDSGRIQEPTAILCAHNPDGHAALSRYNARGVDLNRNFPHRWTSASEEPPGNLPLSEPESMALHAFILSHRPAKIVSLHWALSELDADGPQSSALAMAMWEALEEDERKPYRLRIHRPEIPESGFCPGSLGQWCGHGLTYPDGMRPAMVTLELPYLAHVFTRPDPLPEDHLDRIAELWRSRPDTYLAGIQGSVHRMLETACRMGHDGSAPSQTRKG